MGNSVTRVAGCFVPSQHEHDDGMAVMFSDEGIGHTFCYIRPTLDSSASQSSGDQSHSNSSCLNPESESGASLELEDQTTFGAKVKHLAQQDKPPLPQQQQPQQQQISETSFKCISGASVSANTSTSRSIACLEQFNAFSNGPNDRAAAFESTASFAALPLQPIPRGIAHSGPLTAGSMGSCSGPLDRGFMSGPLERGFMSGPLERGFLSGPLERGSMSGPLDRGYLSGPLDQAGMLYSSGSQRRRKKSLADFVKDASMPMRRAIHRTVSNIARGRKHTRHRRSSDDQVQQELMMPSEIDTTRSNLQWAQGKAGEDRVHIVLSEEHGWMFVGIYDGFNGPDAPDFLMSNLYQAIYKELQGLLWDQKEAFGFPRSYDANGPGAGRRQQETTSAGWSPMDYQCAGTESDRKQHEDRMVCGASGGEPESREQGKSKSLLGGKLKQAYRRKKRDNNYKKLFQWRYEHERRIDEDMEQEVDSMPIHSSRGRAVDHSAVLRALERALEATEQAYLEMTERAVADNPELALVGSCLLVMLMKDEDVYIMNVGDSRAVLAQDTRHHDLPRSCKGQASTNESKEADQERIGARDSMLRMELERIIEETPTELAALESSYDVGELRPPPSSPFLVALQLSTDHSTNIEEEVMKIRVSHPDDEGSVTNDRVKGRLKVTRAFGAGFLKQPKLNDALLEMFRIDFIGDAPYITCTPSLQHHRLGPRDQFLVLSSDGLYQYLSNQEVVAHVEWFLEKFPDGDPAQYLIEELLFRAAKKAGMDFHELLEIPQGDRRRYHDDVSLMVISLEGRIWRSSS